MAITQHTSQTSLPRRNKLNRRQTESRGQIYLHYAEVRRRKSRFRSAQSKELASKVALNLGRLGSLVKLENIIPIILLTTAAGLSRPREAVAIVDCWIWQMATENLFSKSLISQRQLFAIANNSRKQTSLPHRHRLKVRNSQIDKK